VLAECGGSVGLWGDGVLGIPMLWLANKVRRNEVTEIFPEFTRLQTCFMV